MNTIPRNELPYLSPYLQCMQCMKVVNDPTYKLVTLDEKCPECGKSGEYRRGWPSLFGSLWMDVLYKHKVEKLADRYFLAVMLCACAEHLTGELLGDILLHQGATPEHSRILLDVHDGRERRLRLFKNLTAVPFKDACVEAKFPKFYDSWVKLSDTRNHVAHGVPPTPGLKVEPVDADMSLVRDQMLPVFAALHNKFAA
jgi:hypothetical protein